MAENICVDQTCTRTVNLVKCGVHFITLFMFKYVKNTMPCLFHSMFTRNSEIHNYSTRQANYICTPYSRTHLMKCSIRGYGPNVWNNYLHIDNNCTLNCYKKRIKQCLLAD